MRALRPFFCCLIGIMNVLIVPEAKLYGQAVDGEVGVPDAMAVAEGGEAADIVDAAAEGFLRRCAACHTVGGGAIGDAPDLLPSTQWARPDLLIAIQRMEKNVGPLEAAEVDQLADLMLDPAVSSRLQAAREQQVAQRRSELAPASATRGRELFLGQSTLQNGGIACSACHKAGAQGGNLARDLTHVFDRLGETALLSAIEGANFPVMRPAYAGAPVTPQEAAHLTEYLRTVHAGAGDPTIDPPAAGAHRLFGWLGLLVAGGALVGSAVGLKRVDRAGGVRARLVKRAQRSRKQ